MSLSPGTRLGSYEVIGSLGAGGMGEVYRARDAKLNRDVAIKVLPVSFANDPERLVRFQREAQVLASLNHPNIATVYGLETIGAGHGLVMELVEGPTLADRVAEGPMPVDEALPLAKQIVDALDAAHSQGIVHRDLKPANIKIRPDGAVKVLDFGLAKALDANASSATADAMNSPTLTARATQMGMIIGTAAYMAPEQARGRSVDRRADIWAFGCVLYEMVAGKRLFLGEDVTETLASVVKENPSLESAPPRLQRLLRKCLEKDPRRRLRDIGDAWDLIEIASTSATSPSESRTAYLAWSVAALAIVAAIGVGAYHYFGRPAPVTAPTTSFQVTWPIEQGHQPGGGAHFFQISPNGRYLAIASENSLWVRALAEIEPVKLERTQGATYPFWSPDSEQIGFFQNGQLMVIPRAGGSPRLVGAAPTARGGTWSTTGTIVFSQKGGELAQVSEQGGTPQSFMTPTAAIGFSAGGRRYPQFLPDGKRFLYLQIDSKPEVAGVYVGTTDGMTPKRVLEGSQNALFGRSGGAGYLLFAIGDTLMAQSFDADRLAVSGSSFPVATGVGQGENTGLGAFSVGGDGELAVAPGVDLEFDLAWVNRAGVRGDTIAAKMPVSTFALSPDQKRVAVGQVVAGRGLQYDIWIQTIGASASKFTFGPSPGWMFPQWSPTGDEIAFATPDLAGQAKYEIRKKRSDMAGPEEKLYESPEDARLWDWSRDGKQLVFSQRGVLYLLPLAGDRKPVQFAKSAEANQYAQISPNGRWMAYTSGPLNATQVYVQPIPPTGALWQISRDIATMPRWGREGKELYYRAGDGNLMAVPVNDSPPGGAFSFSTTHEKLFPVRTAGNVERFTYAPARDGSKFLVTLTNSGGSLPISVVLNWRKK